METNRRAVCCAEYRIADGTQAYLSVHFDQCRATITTPAGIAAQLESDLRAIGVVASPVSLRGRFHWTGHGLALDTLTSFCRDDERLHFPEASNLTMPTRSNRNGQILTSGPLHLIALRSLLVDQPRWYDTVERVVSVNAIESPSFYLFGYERCIPPSLLHRFQPQVSCILCSPVQH